MKPHQRILAAGLMTAMLVLGWPLPGDTEENPGTVDLVLPQEALTAPELVALFSDKTVYSVTAVDRRESVSYYAPSGDLRQRRHGITRSGRWRVTANHRICLQMEDLPEKCRIVVKEQGVYRKYIVKKNGKHQHSVFYPKFEEGNPLGL